MHTADVGRDDDDGHNHSIDNNKSHNSRSNDSSSNSNNVSNEEELHEMIPISVSLNIFESRDRDYIKAAVFTAGVLT